MACKTRAYNFLKHVRQVSTKPLHNSLHFCVDSMHDIDWFYCSTAPPPQPHVQATCAKVKCHVIVPKCQGEDIKSLMELVVDRMAGAPGFEL